MPNLHIDPQDPLDDLVAECVARHAKDGYWPLDELCLREPEFAEELRSRIRKIEQGEHEKPVSHSSKISGSSDGNLSLADRLRRLGERSALADRYKLLGEVARGGMGAIVRAIDLDLGRALAMKVILPRPESQEEGKVDPQVLERFIEEAQITGQLDHPGVVPVHELGLDASGRVYFTMRLVRGRTADEIFAMARARTEGWTHTRALEVMLKVCDTLAYAHSKGVIHRDLKPSNVMVGKFGEVYVMDWGLAKVLGKADSRDLRIRPQEASQVSRIRTDRSKETESDPNTALRTMDGAIVGTPCYMPPEQANGQVEAIEARSDVYAAGAMLYTLLAGVQPYIRPGSQTSPYMILEWVRQSPPQPIRLHDPKAPAELVAICERAMARRIEERYPSMNALSEDLRAYLEGRVVSAYRTGARAELWKWMQRNRGMAAGLAVAILSILIGGVGAAVYARQADVERQAAVVANQESTRQSAAALAAREAAEAEAKRAGDALRKAEEEQVIREEEESRRRVAERKGRLQERKALRDLLAALSAQHETHLNSAQNLRVLDTVEMLLARHLAGAADASTLESDLAAWVDLTPRALHMHPAIVEAVRFLALKDATSATGALARIPEDPQSASLTDHLAAVAAWEFDDWWTALSATKDQRLRTHLLLDRADCEDGRDKLLEIVATANIPHLGAELARHLVDGSPNGELISEVEKHLRSSNDIDHALLARAHLSLGDPHSALQELTKVARDSVSSDAIYRLERARCWLSLHMPSMALAELQPETAFRCVFRPHRRMHAEFKATAMAMLGNSEAAVPLLRIALRETSIGDDNVRTRLTLHLATALDSIQRPEQALAALVELQESLADKSSYSEGMRSLRRSLATKLGRLDLLGPNRTQTADFWESLPERAANDPIATLRDLQAAAEDWNAWLQAYARFRGPAVGLSEIAQIEKRGRIALEALRIALQVNPAIGATSAWSIFEAFATPVHDLWSSRAMPKLSTGTDGLKVLRAEWLANPMSKHAMRGRTVLALSESRSRDVQPWLAATLLPDPANPMQLRKHLPDGACLLALAGTTRSGLACRITRQGISWLPYEVSGRREEWLGGSTVVGHARDILGQVLGGVNAWRQVVLVTYGELLELPWEAAIQSQIAQHPRSASLVRAPSIRAWLARANQNVAENSIRFHASPSKSDIVALVAGEGSEQRGEQWRKLLAQALGGTVRILVGNESALIDPKQIKRPACLVLSAPFAEVVAAGRYALQISAYRGSEHHEGIHLHSLMHRDLGARLCIVHVAGVPSPHHVHSLAGLVHGLWAAGCRSVLTISADVRLDEIAPLLQAMEQASLSWGDITQAWDHVTSKFASRIAEPNQLHIQMWTAP